MSLLESLLDSRAEFVLVGGMAAVAHGSSQLTRDLDISVPLEAGNFLKIQEALRSHHPMVRAGKDRISLNLDAATASRLRNLYILTDQGNLDCLGDIPGIGDFGRVVAQSIELEIAGRSCRVLSIEALIRAKETIGRPRDLLVVAELRAILELRSRH